MQLIAIGALGAGAVGYSVITDNRIDGLTRKNQQLEDRVRSLDSTISNLSGRLSQAQADIIQQEAQITHLNGGMMEMMTTTAATTTTTTTTTGYIFVQLLV